MSAYAIGDIHGCSETFKHLIQVELKIQQGDALYLLGDLIDRGPSSKDVLDEIVNLKNKGVDVHLLRGNHEQLLINGLEEPLAFNRWLRAGGQEFLNSFNTTDISEVPELHLNLIKETELITFYKDFILVHAGLDFSFEDPFENKEAFLWIRSMEPNADWLGGRRIIHGHTPQTLEDIKSQNGFTINLDGGCVFPERGGMGYLVALELDSLSLFYCKYRG